MEHADHGHGQVAKKAWTPTLDTLHEGGVTHIITAVDQKNVGDVTVHWFVGGWAGLANKDDGTTFLTLFDQEDRKSVV